MLNSNIYNVLVTGSNGQLGSEIKELSKEYSYNFFFTDRSNIDITSKESIKEFCQTNSINVIINCAAYTAVDNYIYIICFTEVSYIIFVCDINIISSCEEKVISVIFF